MAGRPQTYLRRARSWQVIFSEKAIWQVSGCRLAPYSAESQAARRPLPASEGERILRICNACRYCEGYCAVFPAMERRQTFAEGDLNYLANLCHNCSECYYACQYAPP